MTFPYLNESQDLTDTVRLRAGGSFIQLTDGICHYELNETRNTQYEIRNTPTIVLVHGFSVPYFIWDPTFEFLAQSGFRVLRFDLFGRGYSDRPRVRYGMDLYVRQLHDLLDALDVREPVCLAGLSMGGPIAGAFTDQHPERIGKLILIDPSGAKPIALSAPLKVAKIRGLGELLLGLAGDDTLLKGIASDFYDPALIEAFIERYRPQMKIRGFKRAILSTLRENMLGSFLEIYQRVGALNKPTLIFWGRHDTTVPFEHSELVRAAMPHAEFHAVENVGHIPHYEKPGEVNPILLEFLNKKSLP